MAYNDPYKHTPRIGSVAVDTSSISRPPSQDELDQDTRIADLRTQVQDKLARESGDYATDEYGEIAGSHVLRGFTSGLGSVGKALGDVEEVLATTVGESLLDGRPTSYQHKAEDTWLYKAGQAVEDFGKRADINPEYADKFESKVAHGLGTMGSMMAGGTLGYVAKGTKFAAGVGAMGVAEGMIEQEIVTDLERTLGRRATSNERAQALAMAAPIAGLELLPLGRAFNRVGGAGVTRETIQRMVQEGGTKAVTKAAGIGAKKGLVGGAEEAIQEGLENVAMNINASDVMGYDKDREAMEGLRESMEVGGATGFLVNAVAAGLGVKLRYSQEKANVAERAIQEKQETDAVREEEAVRQEMISKQGELDLKGGKGGDAMLPADRAPDQPTGPADKQMEMDFGPMPTTPEAAEAQRQEQIDSAFPPDTPQSVKLSNLPDTAFAKDDGTTLTKGETNQIIINEWFEDGEVDPEQLNKVMTDLDQVLQAEMQLLEVEGGRRPGQTPVKMFDIPNTDMSMTEEQIETASAMMMPLYQPLIRTKYTNKKVAANNAMANLMGNIMGKDRGNVQRLNKNEKALLQEMFAYSNMLDQVAKESINAEGKVDPALMEAKLVEAEVEEVSNIVEEIEAKEKATIKEKATLRKAKIEVKAIEQEAKAVTKEVAESPKFNVEPTVDLEQVAQPVAQEQAPPTIEMEEVQALLEEEAVTEAPSPTPRQTDGEKLAKYRAMKEEHDAGGAEMTPTQLRVLRNIETRIANKGKIAKPKVSPLEQEAVDAARKDLEGQDPDVETGIDFMVDESAAEWEGQSLKNLQWFLTQSLVKHPLYHGTFSDNFNVIDLDMGELGFHVGTNAAAIARVSSQASTRAMSGFYSTMEQALEEARIMPLAVDIRNPFPMADLNHFANPDVLLDEIAKQMQADPELAPPTLLFKVEQAAADYLKKLHAIEAEQYTVDEIDMVRWQELEDSIEPLMKKHTATIREALIDAGFDSVQYENASEDAGNTSYIVLKRESVKHAAQNTGAFDPRDLDINKKEGKATLGMSKGDRIKAKNMLAKIQKQLDSAGVKVITIEDWKNIPRWMNGEFNRILDSGDLTKIYRTRGAVKQNEVVLMLDNIPDIAQFQKTLFHEVIGHYSMETMFGNNFNNFLDKIAGNKRNDVHLKRIAGIYNADLTTLEGRRLAAKEYIAKMSETNDNPSMVKMAVAWVRHQLRKMGIAIKISENDIRAYISKAANRFEKGKLDRRDSYSNQEIMHALAENAPDRAKFVEATSIVDALVEGNMNEASKQHRSSWQKRVDQGVRYITDLGGHNWTVLKKLPDTPSFKALRNNLQANILYYDKTSKFLNEKFKTIPQNEKDAVIDYATDPTGNIENVPMELREATILARETIDKLGQALVDQGVLDRDTYNSNKGKYLPRLYLYFLTGDTNAITGTGGSKRSIMSFLKRRKLGDSKEDQEIRAMLGEIKDPEFLFSHAISTMGRDVAIGNYLTALKTFSDHQKDKGQVENWIFPTDWVEVDGKNMSLWYLEDELNKLRENVLKYDANPETIAQINKYQDVLTEARLAEEQLQVDMGLYKRIPEDKKKYGMLAGLSIRKEIYDDMVGNASMVAQDQSAAEKILGEKGAMTTFQRLWKSTKTVLNPPAHARNFVGNLINFDISTNTSMAKVTGMVMEEMKHMLHAWKTGTENTSKWNEIAIRHGVPKSTFTAQETIEAKQEYIYKLEKSIAEFEENNGKKMGKLGLPMMMTGAIKLNEFMGAAYQGSETLFKTAKIRDFIQNWEKLTGKSFDTLEANEKLRIEAEAVNEANHWIFDYSMVPKSIRYLRNAPIGAPFITFSYLALPRVMEGVARHPQKFIKYVALPYVLAQAAMAGNDIDDEELKKWEASLPEFMEDNMSFYILPWKDSDTGEIHTANFGYYFPWEPWTKLLYKDIYQAATTDEKEFDAVRSLGNLGILSGPLPDTLIAMKSGVDTFTGRPISNEYDTDSKRFLDKLAYMYNMAAPPIIGTGMITKAADLIGGTIDPRTGHPAENAWTTVPRLAGVNVYKTDTQESARARRGHLKAKVERQKSHNRKELRDAIRQGKTPEHLANLRKTHRELVKARQDILKRYNRRLRGEG